MASQGFSDANQIVDRTMNTGCLSDRNVLRCKSARECVIQMPPRDEIINKLRVGAKATIYIGDPNGGCRNTSEPSNSQTTCIRVLKGKVTGIKDEPNSLLTIGVSVTPKDQQRSEKIPREIYPAYTGFINRAPGLLMSEYILQEESQAQETRDVSVSISTDNKDERLPKILGLTIGEPYESDEGRPTHQAVSSFGNFPVCKNAADNDAHWSRVALKMDPVWKENKQPILDILTQLKMTPVKRMGITENGFFFVSYTGAKSTKPTDPNNPQDVDIAFVTLQTGGGKTPNFHATKIVAKQQILTPGVLAIQGSIGLHTYTFYPQEQGNYVNTQRTLNGQTERLPRIKMIDLPPELAPIVPESVK